MSCFRPTDRIVESTLLFSPQKINTLIFSDLSDVRTENTVDTVLVRILVKDENDNKPVFYKQRYKSLISEQPEPGTDVAMVKAFDKDSGKNAELEYFLVSGSVGFFRINSK